MKIKSPISKNLFSNNYLTRLPPLRGGLGWGFLFLLTTTLQAQKTAEPNLPRITDSLKTIFYKNAKRAALTEEKTNELVKIIDERNKVIADYDAKRKRYNAPYSIQDPGFFIPTKLTKPKSITLKKLKTYLPTNNTVILQQSISGKKPKRKQKKSLNNCSKAIPV